MKILFIQFASGYYIAPMLLSSVLKKHGHNTSILVESDDARILNHIKQLRPDIIAFSCTTGNHIWAARIARKIKQSFDVVTIAGGPHPTFFPDFIEEQGIDVVARGEAEFAIAEMVDNIQNGKDITSINNLWVKKNNKVYKNDLRDLLENLDKLPYPDRSLYRRNAVLEGTSFVAGRGCPYNCSFCFNHSSREMYKGKGRYVRIKSPKATIAEIEDVKIKHGLKKVVFDDDIFITDRRWLAEFCRLYRKNIKLPFKCFVRANLVDEELVMMLKESMCETVYFGIESGDQGLRTTILNKAVTDEQLVNAGRLFNKHGIKIGTFNMMGIPTETTEQALKTIRLNRLAKADYPRIMLLQPYPKTKIAEFAVENGYMDQFSADEFGVSFLRKSLIKQNNINELINLQRLAYFAIKSRLAGIIIKRLAKLPNNRLFDLLFLISLTLMNAKENKESLLLTALRSLSVVKQAY